MILLSVNRNSHEQKLNGKKNPIRMNSNRIFKFLSLVIKSTLL